MQSCTCEADSSGLNWKVQPGSGSDSGIAFCCGGVLLGCRNPLDFVKRLLPVGIAGVGKAILPKDGVGAYGVNGDKAKRRVVQQIEQVAKVGVGTGVRQDDVLNAAFG